MHYDKKITVSPVPVWFELVIYGILNDWLVSKRLTAQPSKLSWNREALILIMKDFSFVYI